MTRSVFCLFIALTCCLGAIAPATAVEMVRLKDLGKFAGWRDNELVGYGVVTGLAGTGDSLNDQATRQSIANILAQFDVNVNPNDVVSRNVATVMVTATLPPYAVVGDTIDVTVTSMGDARSLVGGNLLVTPLRGPDNKVYALTQGAVSVGGYKYDMNGTLTQKNHPTAGSIPNGAIIEKKITANLLRPDGKLTFTLSTADITTAARVARAINQAFSVKLAHPRNAEAIDITPPGDVSLIEFMSRIEDIAVTPDTRARVVVDERTGTIVAGGDVQIDKVVISHGDLKISIVTDNMVSQPVFVGRAGPGIHTESLANSSVDVQESGHANYISAHNTVADLIQALTRIKTNTRDIISILRAVKSAGALHAELIIQ